MTDRPLVSIIISTYQSERYVGDAIRSALTQTWTHLEVIVINDGSTDGSRLLLDWMAREDPRIQLVHQPHAGHHASRNVGLALARGSFIGFLDADDLLAPDKVARHLEAFRRSPHLDMTYGDHICLNDVDRKRFLVPRRKPPLPLNELFVYQNWFPPFSPLLRRSLVDRVGPFDERFEMGEDWDYWFRCLEIANVGYVPGPTGIDRLHPSQAQRNVGARTNGHAYFARKHFAQDIHKQRACLASMHAQELKAARAAGAWTRMMQHLTALLWHSGGFRRAMQVWSLLE